MNILDSSWLSPVSIVSMGEKIASAKDDHSIFNRKTCMGLKKGEHPRFYQYNTRFPLFCIPLTWIILNSYL